jgi:hypothetical protein
MSLTAYGSDVAMTFPQAIYAADGTNAYACCDVGPGGWVESVWWNTP